LNAAVPTGGRKWGRLVFKMILARLWPLAALLLIHAGSAGAQQASRSPNLNLGDAVVTGF